MQLPLVLGVGDFLWFIIGMPLLLVGSAFASGSETALFCLTPGDRARLRRTSPVAGKAVEAMLAKPRQLLLFVLLLNMLSNISYFVASSLLTGRVEGTLPKLLVSLISVLTIILFGEVLAKMLARAHRVRACKLFAAPLLALRTLLDPLLRTVDRWMIAPLTRLVGGSERVVASDSIAAQLRELVEADSGQLDEVEQRLLTAVVELRDARCVDVLTPRQDVPTIPAAATRADVIRVVRESRRTLLPVVDDSAAGEVVSLLRVKAFLASGRDGAGSIAQYCVKPLYIPESARLDGALEQLRGAGRSIAVCVDEHGGFAGVLEIEDVVDELLEGIGEDRTPEIGRVEMVGLGVWHVPGSLRLRELSDLFTRAEHPPIESLGKVRTVAGLVVHELGRVPGVGDRVEVSGLGLTVEAIEERRVVTVRVELLDASGRDTPREGGRV